MEAWLIIDAITEYNDDTIPNLIFEKGVSSKSQSNGARLLSVIKDTVRAQDKNLQMIDLQLMFLDHVQDKLTNHDLK